MAVYIKTKTEKNTFLMHSSAYLYGEWEKKKIRTWMEVKQDMVFICNILLQLPNTNERETEAGREEGKTDDIHVLFSGL